MNDLSALFKLSAAERIQLAEDLWDSLAADPSQIPPVTDVQRAEIERRLARHASDHASTSWDEVRAKLWSLVG